MLCLVSSLSIVVPLPPILLHWRNIVFHIFANGSDHLSLRLSGIRQQSVGLPVSCVLPKCLDLSMKKKQYEVIASVNQENSLCKRTTCAWLKHENAGRQIPIGPNILLFKKQETIFALHCFIHYIMHFFHFFPFNLCMNTLKWLMFDFMFCISMWFSFRWSFSFDCSSWSVELSASNFSTQILTA